jgi:hypothetical protein
MSYKVVKNEMAAPRSKNAVVHISPFPQQQKRDIAQARRHDNDMKKLERLHQHTMERQA